MGACLPRSVSCTAATTCLSSSVCPIMPSSRCFRGGISVDKDAPVGVCRHRDEVGENKTALVTMCTSLCGFELHFSVGGHLQHTPQRAAAGRCARGDPVICKHVAPTPAASPPALWPPNQRQPDPLACCPWCSQADAAEQDHGILAPARPVTWVPDLLPPGRPQVMRHRCRPPHPPLLAVPQLVLNNLEAPFAAGLVCVHPPRRTRLAEPPSLADVACQPVGLGGVQVQRMGRQPAAGAQV